MCTQPFLPGFPAAAPVWACWDLTHQYRLMMIVFKLWASLPLPKGTTYEINWIFAFLAPSIGLVPSREAMSLLLSEEVLLKFPRVLSSISVKCLPLKLCSYLEKIDMYHTMIYECSLTVSDLHIFLLLFLSFLPQHDTSYKESQHTGISISQLC